MAFSLASNNKHKSRKKTATFKTMLRSETIILLRRETKVRENRQTVADIYSQSDFPISDGDDCALDALLPLLWDSRDAAVNFICARAAKVVKSRLSEELMATASAMCVSRWS